MNYQECREKRKKYILKRDYGEFKKEQIAELIYLSKRDKRIRVNINGKDVCFNIPYSTFMRYFKSYDASREDNGKIAM